VPTVLKLEGVKKSFGTILAVDELSLEVGQGEIFGLLGPNGAGKTTTISMCLGLIRPESGTIHIGPAGNQHPPTDSAARAMLGVAPQAIALYDELSALENLRFFASLYEMSSKLAQARIEEALNLTGLADRAKHRVASYSGGMKRRLNLAAAILHEPLLVFMDEPTAGVDPQSRHAIATMVQALKQRGCTIVYSTHYMEEAEKICDRIGIMDKGRLLALGTVDQLVRSHGGRSTVELTDAMGNVERIATDDPLPVLAKAINRGDVREASVLRPNLETVFLNLTGRTLRD